MVIFILKSQHTDGKVDITSIFHNGVADLADNRGFGRPIVRVITSILFQTMKRQFNAVEVSVYWS